MAEDRNGTFADRMAAKSLEAAQQKYPSIPPPVQAGAPGSVAPPEALTAMAAAAARRRIDTVSLVRETTDGLPIGWILRFGSTRDDSRFMTVFAGPDSALRCYLGGEKFPTEQVDGWIAALDEAPVDEDILTLFGQGMANGWTVVLEREDLSFHSRPFPDLLHLRAEAPDYGQMLSRPTETVHVSRHEGETGFNHIVRSNPAGGTHPLRISFEEASALLDDTAPMTVGTYVYDEETDEWVLPLLQG